MTVNPSFSKTRVYPNEFFSASNFPSLVTPSEKNLSQFKSEQEQRDSLKENSIKKKEAVYKEIKHKKIEMNSIEDIFSNRLRELQQANIYNRQGTALRSSKYRPNVENVTSIPCESPVANKVRAKVRQIIKLQNKRKYENILKTFEEKAQHSQQKIIHQLEQMKEEVGSETQRQFLKSQPNQYDSGDKPKKKGWFNYYVHDRKYRFARNSCWFFSDSSKIRKALVWIITLKYFDLCILLLVLANSIIMGMRDFTASEETTVNRFVDNMELVFTVIFFLEAIIKIIAMGLLLEKGTYLRDLWNILDFTVIFASVLSLLFSMESWSFIRTLRIFRSLRSLKIFPSISLLLNILFTSFSQLFNIVVMLFFFFLIFGIIGINSWGGIIYNRCYETPHPVFNSDLQKFEWNVDTTDTQICSNFMGSHSCRVNYYCGNWFKEYENNYIDATDINLEQDARIEELNWGITHFDNIGGALLTIFQCCTLEGWTKIMYIMMDGYYPFFSPLYFCLLITICTYFVMNLSVAIMYGNYSKDESIRRRFDAVAKIIESRDDINETKKYLQSSKFIHACARIKKILQKPSFQNNSNTTTSLVKSRSQSLHMLRQITKSKKNIIQLKIKKLCTNFVQRFIYKGPIQVPHDEYHRHCVVRNVYKFVGMPLFQTMTTLFIVLNTIILATDKYPPLDEEIENYLEIGNILFSILFALETIFRMIASGFIKWSEDRYNLFDAVIAIMSLVELGFSNNSGSVVMAFRTLRLFRILKIARVSSSFKILLDSISHSIPTLMSFTLLIVIFIYVYTLMGMQFFAGKLKFNSNGELDLENGTLPRANFDSLRWATVTVFEILVGDGWENIMYSCIRSVGWLSSFYFITLICFGRIIMLNLLMAILIGNFSTSRAILMEMRNQELQNQRIKKIKCDSQPLFASKERSKQLYNRLKTYPYYSPILFVNTIFKSPCLQTNNTPAIQQHSEEQKQQTPKKIREKIIVNIKKNSSDESEDNTQSFSFQTKKPNPEGRRASMMVQLQKPTFDLMNIFKQRSNTHHESRESQRIEEESNSFTEENIDFERAKKNNVSKIKQTLKAAEIQFLKKPESIKEDFHYTDSSQNKINFDSKFKPKGTTSPKTLSPNSPPLGNRTIFSDDHNYLPLTPSPVEINPIIIQMETFTHRERKKPGIWSYLRDCSLFLFHKDSRFRRTLMELVIIQKAEDANENTDELDLDIIEEEIIIDPARSESHQDSNINHESINSESIDKDISLQKVNKVDLNEGNQDTNYETKQFHKSKTIFFAKKATKFEFQDEKAFCKMSRWICKNKAKFFDYCVLAIIIFSSITLAIDTNLDPPDSPKRRALAYIEYVCTMLFLLEALIKIIALGFIWTPSKNHSYLQSGWNILDFLVVITCLIDFLYSIQEGSSSQFRSFKALRTIRTLRPLRMISQNESLKILVDSLLRSIPSILNVFLVIGIFWMLFGILGIYFFKGEFYSCELSEDSSNLISTIVTKDDCLLSGGKWENKRSNFDNIFFAIMSLIELMKGEGWTDLMHSGIDSIGIDYQPIRNNNQWWILFFVGIIIIGNFFFLNLFVGVVIDNFNQMKQEVGGFLLLTKEQQEWVHIQRFMFRRKLRYKRCCPPQPLRKKSFNIAESKSFDYLITLVIILNSITLAIKYYQMNETYALVLEYLNGIFAIFFTIECIIKLVAWGKSYFQEDWNKFDFCVVIGTIFGFILTLFMEKTPISTISSVMRTFRVMRLIRLFKIKQITVVIDSLVFLLPSLANIGGLMILRSGT